MKKILVTGASGFIGRHTLPILVKNGWEVHAVGYPAPNPKIPGCVWHTVDLLDREAARKLMLAVRAGHWLHLAWYAEPVKYWTSSENFRWVTATLDMVEAFREAGGRHIIGAGTCAEYDWSYGHFHEELTPLGPTTVYGKCKHALRHLLEAYGAANSMRVAWGRVFYLYGPHEAPGRLVSGVIRSLLKGEEVRCTHGEQVRDFLHVTDVASAFACIAGSPIAGAVNIGSGEPVHIKNIVEAIAGELKARDLVRLGALPASPGEPPLIVASNQRLRDLGWSPAYSLERGLAHTINWWKTREKLNESENKAAH